MREVYEFRVAARFAEMLFEPNEGKRLGLNVVKIELDQDDPRLPKVGQMQSECLAVFGKSFFWGWDIHRIYKPSEIAAAPLLALSIDKPFEPVGTMCGTVYDESDACPVCGAGRARVGPLRLNLRRVPKKVDIAETIAGDEIVVRKSWVEAIESSSLRAPAFEPIAPRRSRREALPRPGSDPFWTFWPSSLIGWSDLTRCANGPFDSDPLGEFRCPRGCTRGLNRLSELYVREASWDRDADFMRTDCYVGRRVGELVPSPILVISQRALRTLKASGLRGWSLEVVRLDSDMDESSRSDA